MSETLSIPCPTCKKNVEWTDQFPYRPFCSERCKLIDLGEWASESHVIEGEPIDPLHPLITGDDNLH